MKKHLISLALIGILTVALFPVAALGVEGPPAGCTITRDMGISECSGSCSFNESSNCGMCCLLQSIYNITDWLFVFLVALTTVYVVMGAMKILMARDSAEEVDKGRKYIMYAALGLLVAFLAKAVPQVVKMVSGFGSV